jgi:hypothetical protein
LFWDTKNFGKDEIIKIIKRVFEYANISVVNNNIKVEAMVGWNDKTINIFANIDIEKQ